MKLDLDKRIAGEIWVNSEIENNLDYLCDHIGERWAGTDNDLKAANYVKERFNSYGLKKVVLEEFPFKSWEETVTSISASCSGAIPLFAEALVPNKGGKVEGLLIDLRGGIPEDLDFYSKNLKDKIVMLSADPHPPFYDKERFRLSIGGKIALCQRVGASGVLVVNVKNAGYLSSTWFIKQEEAFNIPAAVIPLETGEYLKRALRREKDVRVVLEVGVKPFQATSQNVIGVCCGKGDEDIYLNAHIDTVRNSPGAIDDGSGMVVMMEVARVLASLTNEVEFLRNIYFVAFGAEEQGLAGSLSHVESRSDSLEQIRFVLGLDELGGGRMKGYELGGATRRLELYLNSILDDMNSPFRFHARSPLTLDPSGDNYSFTSQGKGIEAGYLWTWKYIGEYPTHQYVHSPADTIDKLEIRDLKEYSIEIARLLLRLALHTNWGQI